MTSDKVLTDNYILSLDEYIDLVGEPTNEHELASLVLEYDAYKEKNEHDKNS